jgi:hypothetical protein
MIKPWFRAALDKPWKIYRLDNTERWYDRHNRCWWIREVDANGDQIGDSQNCYTATEAIAIQNALAKQPNNLTKGN